VQRFRGLLSEVFKGIVLSIVQAPILYLTPKVLAHLWGTPQFLLQL